MCLEFRNNPVAHKKLDGRNELKEMSIRYLSLYHANLY